MDHVETAPVALTYAELAAVTEVRLPARSDEALRQSLAEAEELSVGMVAVDPVDVDVALQALSRSTVRVAAVCGAHHTTAVKLYEARDALRRGAKQINAFLTRSKIESRHFQYVEMELIQLAQACHESGAKLKLVLDTANLSAEAALVACKMAKRSEVDLIGAGEGLTTAEELALLLRKCPPLVGVASVVETMEAAQAALQSGAVSLCASLPALRIWRAELALPRNADSAVLS